jgi:hypothetical protein
VCKKIQLEIMSLLLAPFLFFPDEMILISHSATEVEDHPLNPNPESQWQGFFKDNEVLLQVL